MAEEEVQTSYTYRDGHKETATWCTRAGVALVQYPNGDTFEGHFSSKREKEGNGTYTYVDEEGRKSVYEGMWRGSKRHGFGVMKYANGDVYEGTWKDGIRSGLGTFRYANGDVFSGEWVDDVKQGSGAYVFAEPKSQLVGLWKNNECVRGKWATPDAMSFHGKFQNGKPIGSGVYYHSHGLKQEAAYIEAGGDEEKEAEEEDGDNAERERIFQGGKISRALGSTRELVFKVNTNEAQEDEDFIIKARPKPPPPPSEEEKEEAVSADMSEEVQHEIDALEELFASVDKDNDGGLDIEELVEAIISSAETEPKFASLMSAAPMLSEKSNHSFFKDIDSDKNGKLNLSEFRDYFYMMKLFHFVDADGSGKVRHGELRSALREHPEVFPPHFGEGGTSRIAISALMSAGDMDKDRTLDFPEFVHMMLSVQDALDSSRGEYLE